MKHLDLGAVLDALASKVGFVVAVGGLLTICVWAGLTVERSVQNVQDKKQVFADRQLRNGFVSMSDMQRLLLVVQESRSDGGFSVEQKARFVEAIDFLYVRKDSFRRVLSAGPTLTSADAAIHSLEDIIAISDVAVAADFPDVAQLLADLLAAADQARENLALFLDDMERMQQSVLLDQLAAVTEQRKIVHISLAALTLLGMAALLLLRREVLARHAREQAERSVKFLAYYDQLTRLPNRAQFQYRLDQMLDGADPVALLFIDLDDFKGINDTYGHAAGDAVLCGVAQVLSRQAERANGFAARLGGDEFALIAPTENLDALRKICRAILRDTAPRFDFDGETVSVGLSIGLSTKRQLGENLSPTVDSMSRVTDFALYESKTNGRGQFTLYDNALEHRFLERRAMVDELPYAIQNDDMLIYLQPKVILPDAQIYGFEALVRWKRSGVIVPPDDFISIAEESGLILELDRSVLRAATNVVAAFNAANGTAYSVSVNLSALHFTSPRILTWIQEALTASGLQPAQLTVEITETVELRDWRQARAIITSIHDLGIRISIDDFGTGYSSLSYLRTTMADELKIDRSLVEQIETSDKARFLLDGVLEMAHNLDLHVVVEGIETQAQAQTVEQMGADCAQGYLYGRPLPAAEALKIAADSSVPAKEVG